jgi:hypothetical protein
VGSEPLEDMMTPSLSSSCSLAVIRSAKPVDLMGLGLVGHFSAAQQPLDHGRGYRHHPSAVLLMQPRGGDFSVDDPDPRPVDGEQLDATG